MSSIVAHSVASLYGCKPNLKILHIFEALVIQVFGWLACNRNNTYDFGAFSWQIHLSLPIKNTKILKSLLTNLLRHGQPKTTSRAAGWAALL